MSLQRWKEIAEKRTKAGREVNTLKEFLKQKKITDEMSDIQAEKLFKPITTELKDLSGTLQVPRGSMKKQFEPTGIPDYAILDENGVEQQGDKQIAPVPPPYEEELPTPKTSIKGIQPDTDSSSGDEEFQEIMESLPPEYDEPDVPDYEILEEDRENQILDAYGLVNYDILTKRLQGTQQSREAKRDLLLENIEVANKRRKQLPGFKTHITKQQQRGEIGEAEAQYRRKDIDKRRNVLNDYITYNKNQLKIVSGSGLKRGGGAMFFNEPNEMLKRLKIIIGSIEAGNTSLALRNTGVAILDFLLRNSLINRAVYNKLYKRYFTTMLR